MTYPSMVALFGATQGILLSLVLLLQPSGRPTANKLLGSFILAESLRLFLLAFTYGGMTLPRPEPYALLNVTMALGPLLYFYVRALTEPEFKVDRNMVWHFVPALVLVLVSLPWLHRLSQLQWQTDLGTQTSASYFFWSSFLPIVGFFSLMIYALMSYRKLAPYRRLISEHFSSFESINLNWLRVLILFCLATAITSAAIEVLRLLSGSNLGPRILVSLIMSVMMIYSIGFMGMRQPRIFQPGERREANASPAEPRPTRLGKYEKSGLSPQESAILWEKLELLMSRQQPFLHNGLNLTELAELLDVVPNHLSQIINTHARQSFFDYINRYRVERAKALLRDQAYNKMPIIQLALKSGFNSQNTFYNQFRKKTGTTPSKYRRGV
jgi:AraC-like DNA-binding protein